MCAIDWAALGTWVVGLAAVFIAWQAHRFTSAAGERQNESDSRRCRTYSIAAFLEVQSMRERAEACAEIFKLALDNPGERSVRGLIGPLSAMPSFAPSNWLLESPSVGHLEVDVSSKLARAFSAGAEAERMRSVMRNFYTDLPDHEFSDQEGMGILRGAYDALRALVDKALEAEPALRDLARDAQ